MTISTNTSDCIALQCPSMVKYQTSSNHCRHARTLWSLWSFMLAMVILRGQNDCTRPGVSMTVVFAVGSGVVILVIPWFPDTTVEFLNVLNISWYILVSLSDLGSMPERHEFLHALVLILCRSLQAVLPHHGPWHCGYENAESWLGCLGLSSLDSNHFLWDVDAGHAHPCESKHESKMYWVGSAPDGSRCFPRKMQKRCRPIIGFNWFEISDRLSRDHGSFCCKTGICKPAPVPNTW